MICVLCDRDLKKFQLFKRDLNIKQHRLYELIPSGVILKSTFQDVEEEPLDSQEVLVEALDETFAESDYFIFTDDHNQNAENKAETLNPPKSRRKQNIIEHQSHDKIKKHLQCNECGLFLSSDASMKRHLERVINFSQQFVSE